MKIAYDRLSERINDDIIKYTALIGNGESSGCLISLVDRLHNSFSNRERLARRLFEIFTRINKCGPIRPSEALDQQLYINPFELPIYLLGLLRIYNGQSIFVIGRNSLIIDALNEVSKSDIRPIIEEVTKAHLPKKKDIYHFPLEGVKKIDIVLNSLLTESERSELIKGDLLDELLADSKVGMQLNCGAQRRITRAEALRLLINYGEVDIRFERLNELFGKSGIASKRRIEQEILNSKDDRRLRQQIEDWIVKVLNFTKAYPELSLPMEGLTSLYGEIESKYIDVDKVNIYSRNIARDCISQGYSHLIKSGLRHSSLALLQKLLIGTQVWHRTQKNGLLFVDDIIASGKTLIAARFLLQIIHSGGTFSFVCFFDSSRLEADVAVENSHWAQIPEDWQDVEPIVRFTTEDNGTGRIYEAIDLDRVRTEILKGINALEQFDLAELSDMYKEYSDGLEKIADKIDILFSNMVSPRVLTEIARFLVDVKSQRPSELCGGVISQLLASEYYRPDALIHDQAIAYENALRVGINKIAKSEIEIHSRMLALRDIFRKYDELVRVEILQKSYIKAMGSIREGIHNLLRPEMYPFTIDFINHMKAFREVAEHRRNDARVYALYKRMLISYQRLVCEFAKKYSALPGECSDKSDLKRETLIVGDKTNLRKSIIETRAKVELSILCSYF